MKTSKRVAAWMLVLALLIQLAPTFTIAFAAQTQDMIEGTYGSFNGEGVWITEIYNNDVDRSATNDTLEANGYLPIQLYESASDMMEFVELCSTHDDQIKLNDLYEFYYGEQKLTITDCSGSSDISLTKGQAVVLWNYRTDLATTLPTEAEIRTALRIPDDALVLKAVDGFGWSSNGSFSVKSKSDGELICSFTTVNDTNVRNGFSVELKVPLMGSDLEVYRNLNLPSAGIVYAAQVRGMMTANIPTDFDGKGVYLTEILPNDINRSSTYGTSANLMECFEITNTTDSAIDLNSDFLVTYTVREGQRKVLEFHKYSSSASGHIGSSSGCTVPAGGTAVLWNYRESYVTDATSFPTLSQFRSAYGISSDTPVYIFANQNGLNDLGRALEVFQSDGNGGLGKLVSSYAWLGEADCADGLSVHLQINPEGPAMILNTANGASSMGTVDSAQLQYVLDDGSAMDVRLYDGSTIPQSLEQGEDLRVWFYNKKRGLPRTAFATYYRFDGTGEWYQMTEGGSRVPYRYEVVISGAELFDHDYVEFYVVVSNYYRDTVRGIYRVNIEKLNEVDGIRTNISDGEEVSGTVSITANDGTANSNTKIYIDGVQQTTTPMLEDGGYLNFTADGIDTNFYNAITTNKNKLIHNISKWAYECPNNQVRHIDSSYFSYKSSTDTYNVTLRFWAGTHGTATEDSLYTTANRDDWAVTNVKLKLTNGNDYLPTKVGPSTYGGVDVSTKVNTSTALSALHYIGDSTGRSPYLAFTFAVPASEVTAVGVEIDTTTLSEGAHTLKVTNGNDTKEVTFIVDNTAPVVDFGFADGASLTKNITLNPQLTEVNNVNRFVVTLDGQVINLPYETTAYSLGEGLHTLNVAAMDGAGNETTATATFTVDDISMTLTDAGATDITHSSAKLYLTAQSDSSTAVTFYKAERIDVADIAVTTTDGLVPYIQYTIDAPNAATGDDIVINWNGTASGADSTHAANMFVRNVVSGEWELVGSADGNGNIADVSVPVENHVADGKVTIIVQCTADSALPDLDTVNDGVTGNNASWDGTAAPEDYDFSFAWITDTQYYVQKYNYHFLNINNWIVDNAEAWKIKYVLHTGDIVDDFNAVYQWENADKTMKIFDDAGMPYGVLAGNHDVASGVGIHDYYLTYFNEDRVKDQPTFGGSYKNNLGHYDLISENGQDFIIVYMGWTLYEEEVNWMNEVLAEYADRKAILCFHGYVSYKESADGLLDYYGVMIRDQVVAKNPNVIAVLNGHYSGSTYQTVRFDDNGDGKLDRTVYQICTDYQSVDEGGLEYIKFLYFDLDNDKIFINSYSPYMDDFNYYDTATYDDLEALAKKASNGVVSNTDIDALTLNVDFSVDPQTILANSISVELYTDEVLGNTNLNAMTEKAELDLTGLEAQTEYTWYAVLENENTGRLRTGVYDLTTAEKPAVTVPTLTLVAPSLNFEDEIYYNVYYTASDMTSVVEMGLITFDNYLAEGTIDDALEVIPGYVTSGSNFMSHTNGIPSMKLGDALYFRVYAKLSDGSYAYSPTAAYHAVAYAKDILANSTNEKMKALVVAMLNYGAAAQVHFEYKTDALVNSFLTDEQKALVSEYSSDMVDGIVAADSSKTGNFKAVSGGYSALAPSVVFEGAFSINYYFTPAKAMDGELKLYYWKMDDYNAADVLTAENATGVVVMEETSVAGQYLGAVPGIAAKQIDQTVYVCGVYESNGVSYPTGVIAYSLASYCLDRIANGTETMQAFAAETVVYGYYAKQYFA